jgi:hypothetical protein
MNSTGFFGCQSAAVATDAVIPNAATPATRDFIKFILNTPKFYCYANLQITAICSSWTGRARSFTIIKVIYKLAWKNYPSSQAFWKITWPFVVTLFSNFQTSISFHSALDAQ